MRATHPRKPDASRVQALIIVVTSAATAALMLTGHDAWRSIAAEPVDFGALFVLSLLLALGAVELYGPGRISVGGIGLLAVGFTFGAGPAMAIGALTACLHAIRTRGPLDRMLFNAGTLALASGAATAVYEFVVTAGWTWGERIGPALAAGAMFWAINIGLLTTVMNLDERVSPLTLWRERFRWLTLHYLAFGPLALASTIAYGEVGISGLLAFVVPPALLMLSVRQYLDRTRESVEELHRATEQVRRVHLETIAALSRSMEAKDYYTGGHTERVSDVAVELARRLGYSGADLDAIEIGALLHDIGKIGIPERILRKPGPLDDDEWLTMKQHPVISEYILSGIEFPSVVREIARSSHERIDGTGYPDGLAGEGIPLPARIVFVADALDALTSDRPYRPGRDVLAAMEEIRANAGTQFCPRVTQALEELFREDPDLLRGAEHAYQAA